MNIKKKKLQKKIGAMPMAILLTAAMLTGCGDGSDADAMAFNNARIESLESESISETDETNPSEEITPAVTDDDESEVSENDPSSETDENTPVSSDSGTATAEAYENDIMLILSLSNMEPLDSEDPDETLAQMQAIVDGLDMKSPEGKVIKKDYQEIVDIMTEMVNAMYATENVENFEDIDWNIILEYTGKLEQLSTKMEDHLTAFFNAAQASGVDSDTYESLKASLGL